MRSSKKVKRSLLLSLLVVPILLSGCGNQNTTNKSTDSSSSMSSRKSSDLKLTSKRSSSSSSSAKSKSMNHQKSLDDRGAKLKYYQVGSKKYKHNMMTEDQAFHYELRLDNNSLSLDKRLAKSGLGFNRDDNNVQDAIADAHNIITEYEYPHHKRITLNYILNHLELRHSPKVINKLKRNPKLIFDNTTNAYINRCVKYGVDDGVLD